MTYTHIRVGRETGEAIKIITAIGGGIARRKITQSDALRAACKLVHQHQEAFGALLKAEQPETETE